jgi:hypothetical protein
MNREFALVPGGVKRLRVTCAKGLKNAEVFFDRMRVGTFATKADFVRGSTFTLPDGANLSVRYGPVVGAPFIKEVHLLHNGVPVPGSAADPVPKWTWFFMVACFAIPVVSLGGGLPSVLAFAGITGTISISRTSRWPTAVRVGACALITLACWGVFGAIVTVVHQNTHQSTAIFQSASPQELMAEIRDTYEKQGVPPDTVRRLMSNLNEECGGMVDTECKDYLRSSLQKIKSGHSND